MNRKAFARYADYKDSGVEWLGQVPAHWVLRRIKDLSFLQSGDSIVAEEIEESGLYPVYGGNGLRGYSSNYTNNGIHILIGRQGALCGNIKYACGKFWASEHAVVVYLNPSVNIKWYGEMLRTMNLNQYSLSAAQPGISIDRIKRLLLPVPPLSEQLAIADYLDTQTANLDRQIELLEQKAAHYADLKQSLINRTVTRGLDPTVPLRDSGVEWIGQIPKHWEVKQLKHLSSVITGNTPSKKDKENYLDGTWVWAKPGDLVGTTPIMDSTEKLSDLGASLARIVPKGSVLVCCIGSIGKIGVAGLPLATNQQINAVIFDRPVKWCSQYGVYALLISKSELQRKSSTVVVAILNKVGMESIYYPVPSLLEQRAIAAYLDAKTAHIDRIIATINAKIARLQELRKTLINDVVTGKVRIVE